MKNDTTFTTTESSIEIKGSFGDVPKRSKRYQAPAASEYQRAQYNALKVEPDGDILWA